MSDSTGGVGENSQENKPGKDGLATNNIPKSGNGAADALLVEDYPNMSTAMTNLMASLENPTVEEILVMVLYILIIETGFIPFPSDPVPGDESCRYNAQRLNSLTGLPKSWVNKEGIYKIYFVLSPFSEQKCKLVCVPVGSSLSANMYSSCSGKAFATIVNPSEYVALYPTQVIFKKLKNLSYKFKNEVVIPVRTVVLNEIHQTTVGPFALPVEVLLKIISYLKVDDFLNWTSTCKYFYHSFAYDEHIWKQYCLLKFCRPSDFHEKETYREYYQRKINLRNRVSNLRRFRVAEIQ